MSSGGGGGGTPQQVVTTQNRDPWSGAQPYLQNIMSTAQSNFYNGVGGGVYGGPTQAAVESTLQNALNRSVDMTADPNNLAAVNNARGLANTMQTSQGITPGVQGAITGLQGIAGRAEGNENPYLQEVIKRQMDKVNAAMAGAGRYASGSHDAAIASAIAPTLAQDYQQRQQLLGQTYGQINDIYGQGLNRAGQWAQLAPTLDQARFSDVDRLMGVGNFYQNRAQNEVQRNIDYFNAINAAPSEAIARWSALTNGAGGLGGTTVTSAPNVNAPQGGFAGGLGGALAGGSVGSIFGPVGAGIGALGGGLLGYLR